MPPSLLIAMVKIKSRSEEADYLLLVENTILIEALKIAGIESMPIYKAVRRIIDDKRVEVHIKPVSHRYS